MLYLFHNDISLLLITVLWGLDPLACGPYLVFSFLGFVQLVFYFFLIEVFNMEVMHICFRNIGRYKEWRKTHFHQSKANLFLVFLTFPNLLPFGVAWPLACPIELNHCSLCSDPVNCLLRAGRGVSHENSILGVTTANFSEGQYIMRKGFSWAILAFLIQTGCMALIFKNDDIL